MSKWICKICGYIYDEAKAGLPFADLPDTWVCPLCGADKGSFVREQAAQARPAPAARPVISGEMWQLSAGELAALCSNLARGCEKQYQDREAALFRELADFFSAAAPQVPGDLDDLLELIRRDLEEGYPTLHAGAREASDRGTQRICVWGEKVTNILQALLRRYRKEGAAFLSGTQVWVCTVCGFVYVGDSAPELCPVCKVPAWKFEKIEGRV